MLTINTNLSSLIAQSSMKQSTNKLNQAIERMTTGFKINHASDNAANYSISTNMTTKINSYMVAEDNAAMGLDLISTAEGTLNQIQGKLERLRTLQEQASNGTYGEQSLNAINAEANALVDEINRLYSTAEYNGLKLFGGTSVEVAVSGMRATDPFDDLERVSEAASIESNKSYRIDDSVDLVALQDFVNGGGNTTNVTFELTTDIDMSGKTFRGIGYITSRAFKGIFNGNGHVIKNLTIDTAGDYVGLFGCANNATIDSVGLVNANVKGANYVGGLLGRAGEVTIVTNSYVLGKVKGTDSVGGLVGHGYGGYYGNATITNCYSAAEVSGNNNVGGLIGFLVFSDISSCYSDSTVDGNNYIGGFVGGYGNASAVANSYSISTAVGNAYVGGFLGSTASYILSNCISVQADANNTVTVLPLDEIESSLEGLGFIEANGWTVVNGAPLLSWQKEAQLAISGSNSDGLISLQVGIASDSASQISLNMGFSLTGVNDLRMIGLGSITDYLTQIDDLLALVSEKQTHFGAVSNRLESVLEEITIQRDNLISSRSTIRDADIAEISSSYIQQQILQQASATLLATANQSPSIALQLI